SPLNFSSVFPLAQNTQPVSYYAIENHSMILYHRSAGGREGTLRMTGALQGIKILDLTHVMAGPFCTRQLVLLGAEVIKIEKPGDGDVMRYYGHDPQFGRNSPNFVGYNAGKKSVALD